MPTIFTHALVGGAIGRCRLAGRVPRAVWVWSAACAMLPDADVVGFSLGVPYESLLGHRGITHSFAAAVAIGWCASVACLRGDAVARASMGALSSAGWWAYFSVVTASHGLLDALTDGGRGIALLAPFSAERFYFPWRPIHVSPIGLRFFSARGLDVALSELQWVWVPCALAVGGAWWWRSRR